jgi:hypothetical protein
MLRVNPESIVDSLSHLSGGESILAKKRPAAGRLGTKRRCLACGAKYYDLGRAPPTCSRCGAEAGSKTPAEAPPSAPAVPEPAPARARPIGREWSREQSEAIDRVGRWLKAGEPQVFRLFGYAGVGKTTLARHVAEGAAGGTVFAAFTGKAALVMRGKGCAGATTIHALIYRASEGVEGAPTFTLNEDGPASRAGLIVIDECSMVDSSRSASRSSCSAIRSSCPRSRGAAISPRVRPT